MGRDLKRIAPDFDWPLKKVWKGYINPHSKPCPEKGKTCFNGENAAAVYLSHLASMFGVVGNSARRGESHPYLAYLPYRGEHPDWAVQPKEVRQKAVDLVRKLLDDGHEPKIDGEPPYGFTGSDHILFFKLLEMAGIKNEEGENGRKHAYEWTECSVCKGEDVDPAVKEQYDAWKDYEPPAGEGYQLWETTSEGSPISPVFKTLDELCAWAAENASTFADCKATKEEWKKMLDGGVVCHTEGNVTFI